MGTPVPAIAVPNVWRLCGIPHKRHTFASLLIAAGAHPKLIQARLGHASITTTLDRYGHQFPSVEAALADTLDATFNGAGAPTPLRQVKS